MASATPLNRFIASFVLPLVAGGQIHVRGLIGPGMLQRFTSASELDGTLIAEVTRHVRTHLARIGPVGPVNLLPSDAIALSAVWHNLLAMTHPSVIDRMKLRRRVKTWCEQMLSWVGPPRSVAEVALRHGVLARLGQVGRVDTEVTFWAGSARYVGVAPPTRLLAWRSVRHVQEVKTRVSLFELLSVLETHQAETDLTEPVRLALSYSPITDLALVDRPAALAFQWTRTCVNALGDRALRGAMIRTVLSQPASERTTDVVSQRVRLCESATRALVATKVPAAVARLLTIFHLELFVTEAFGSGTLPAGHALSWDVLARLGTEHTARIIGIDPDTFERAFGTDAHARQPLKDAPSVALLSCAGFLEVSS